MCHWCRSTRLVLIQRSFTSAHAAAPCPSSRAKLQTIAMRSSTSTFWKMSTHRGFARPRLHSRMRILNPALRAGSGIGSAMFASPSNGIPNLTVTVTSMRPSDSWNTGDPYERHVGRWSRLVAGRFLAWLSPRAIAQQRRRWIDPAGCPRLGVPEPSPGMTRRLTSHSIERPGTQAAGDARRCGKQRAILRETQWAT
jgi:hypothetical protein